MEKHFMQYLTYLPDRLILARELTWKAGIRT